LDGNNLEYKLMADRIIYDSLLNHWTIRITQSGRLTGSKRRSHRVPNLIPH
jgi:hypothetical protein